MKLRLRPHRLSGRWRTQGVTSRAWTTLPSGGVLPDGGSELRSQRFGAKFERLLQLREIGSAGLDVLGMDREQADGITLDAMNFARGFRLLQRVVPFLFRLLLGLRCFGFPLRFNACFLIGVFVRKQIE